MTKGALVKISKKGQMVIPKELREFLHVRAGDTLLANPAAEGQILLIAPRQYARLSRGMLKGTWGKTAREVDAYIRKERDSWD